MRLVDVWRVKGRVLDFGHYRSCSWLGAYIRSLMEPLVLMTDPHLVFRNEFAHVECWDDVGCCHVDAVIALLKLCAPLYPPGVASIL